MKVKSEIKLKYFIAWYFNAGKEDYEIYRAVDLQDALEIAKEKLGEDLLDVMYYEP